ncbi:uroporphyrinogen-III C-methyltransferase [Corynebacterium lactis]|uniref:uroporphyrinogen-III C-methyltransferase n=1 Tax=Corynebacterium lactis RW2-5 TaxID=1408189 RepID=A0A0K2GZL5_9CORY|nr:uroporphyrinogen-III C-methyltransferase [Corynebacterium lactis]ALA67224.1 multifunctional uroporphyrinogen III methylase/precorrin-2 oxidase/ferrochelatase [Corynebacterium lactis RW2-5]
MSLVLKDLGVLVIGGSTAAERVIPRFLDSGATITVCEGGEVTTAIEAWAADGRISLFRTSFTPAMSWGKAIMVCCDESLLRDVTREGRRRGILVDDETGSASPLTPVALTGRRASRAGDLAGQVALVGGGPGDPGLITVEGRRLLRLADVVVADHLGPLSLLGELDPDVEIIDAGKLPYGRAMAQERINELLVHRAREGYFVVRLKGGDPYIFGRGFEELQELEEAGIPVRVVPGITSAIAVPGSVGIPVTMRGINHDFTVVSGHVPPGHPKSLVDWDALGRMNGTICIIMGVKNGPEIAESLLASGRSADTPAAVVQEGTMSTQRSVRCTLGTLGETLVNEKIKPPAVIIIGEVVGLGGSDA